VLAEYASLDEVMRRSEHLRRRIDAGGLPDVVDVVPAARTVLVEVRAGASLDDVRTALVEPVVGDPIASNVSDHTAVVIEVRYDGVDLDAVAARCEMSVDEVVAAHTAPDYVVAFCGFVPGFSYLVGLDERLHVPRRATPRPRVPAGSVAIASEFTAVYPAAVPGGWHLLGHTTERMWDDRRPVAALAPPGARVRFVAR
jgi:KipI family sensor histidine kinase inhibitor